MRSFNMVINYVFLKFQKNPRTKPIVFYKWYSIKNVLKLLCFRDKRTFFKVTEKIVKNRGNVGKKYFLTQLNIYLWFENSHSWTSIILDLS